MNTDKHRWVVGRGLVSSVVVGEHGGRLEGEAVLQDEAPDLDLRGAEVQQEAEVHSCGSETVAFSPCACNLGQV